jgi:hypothetical protein
MMSHDIAQALGWVIPTIFIVYFIALFVLVIARWWIFHSVFAVAFESEHNKVVSGYQPGVSMAGKISAFITFPITSFAVIRGSRMSAPTAGQGNLGAGLYTLLTFFFVKPFIFYSLVAAAIMALILLCLAPFGIRRNPVAP